MTIRAYMGWNTDESHRLRYWMGQLLEVDVIDNDKHGHDQKEFWPWKSLQGVSGSRGTKVKAPDSTSSLLPPTLSSFGYC